LELEAQIVNLRYNLILQPAQEEDGDFDTWDSGVARPDLMTEKGEILCRRHNAGDQFPHAEEGIFEDETANIPTGLVFSHEPHTNSTSKALAVDNILVVPSLDPVAQVVQSRLCINVQTRFVSLARREAVTTIFDHEDIATRRRDKHAGNGEAMADVTRIAVEHQDRDVGVGATAGASNVESREFLAIVGRDDQLFKVLKIKRHWSRNLLARIGRYMGRVDEGPAKMGERRSASSLSIKLLDILLFKVEQRGQNGSNPLHCEGRH